MGFYDYLFFNFYFIEIVINNNVYGSFYVFVIFDSSRDDSGIGIVVVYVN